MQIPIGCTFSSIDTSCASLVTSLSAFTIVKPKLFSAFAVAGVATVTFQEQELRAESSVISPFVFLLQLQS